MASVAELQKSCFGAIDKVETREAGDKNTRYLDIREGDKLDGAQMATAGCRPARLGRVADRRETLSRP